MWTADTSIWTVQNTLQSDLAMVGFDEFGDCWGGYNGPSIDLQEAFGVSPTENPESRSEVDTRRKATMMMAGDFYDYFWTDKTDNKGRKGFNYLQFMYDADNYGSGGPGKLQSATGANNVKHLYGDAYDHKTFAIDGISASNMHSSLPTPVLRLSDVYLVYAEAVIGNGTSTTDATAIDAFYKDLEFGTGGLRGIMGAGSNRMNIYTVGMATQGLANYLKKNFANLPQIKVAVCHDCRNNSRLFAETVANIFSANGIKVYLFDDMRPTPECSFAIRHFGCQSGVNIVRIITPSLELSL